MKKAFIAAASISGIIAARMILSVILSEQVADVFTKTATSFLFFYYVLTSTKKRTS
ncbi:MAG: hypothetical protein HFI56_00705 [Lachnospiraceae bacterium]|jgi:hypothetical protein|nr:hypothetical protein [Lachnospiraceae bacterium]MCI9396567.1 hypothetical protein [Lachnospiraceae bacterium]